MSKAHDVAGTLLPALPAGREWLPVRNGESGDAVYRRSDDAAYAKIAHGRSVRDLEGERHRIAWLAQFDLGTAIFLDWTTSGDAACLITSSVPGVPATELSAQGLRQAWPSIAQRLKILHEIPAQYCPFERRLQAMFARAQDVVARNAVNPDFLPPEDRHIPAATLLARVRTELQERLDQEFRDLVVCHGDACLPNIMVDPATHRCVGLIDLGRLGTADRYVDLALLLANARESWAGPEDEQMAQQRLFEVLGISPPDQKRLAFYLRLDPLTWG